MHRPPALPLVALALALLPASAGRANDTPGAPVEAAFAARSYQPDSVATLRLRGRAPLLLVRLYRAAAGHQGPLGGAAVGPWRRIGPIGNTIALRLGHWQSGLYYARLATPGLGDRYAPFVVRPHRLGEHRVLVVLPTNTWQAYNFEDGDSWYADAAVHTVDLSRPYADDGVPPHFRGYDRGFLRWLAREHEQPDVVADDDLEAVGSAAELARDYDLIVFPGHEEYVTAHAFDLVEGYRDRGGNLAFLSANDFFYEVVVRGDRMVGRRRWRDLRRPEAALVGAQYVDWNHDRYPNEPFVVAGVAAAPWLFRGTGLRDGDRFGTYGIEVDERTPDSPPGTVALARIPAIFGRGEDAEMTYYETAAGARVFSAGVMNFGGSVCWPVVSILMANLWEHLRES